MNDTSIIFAHPGFVELAPKIWVIKNFLTEEECAPFVEAGDNATEEGWNLEPNRNAWFVGKVLNVSEKVSAEAISTANQKFRNLFTKKDEYTYGSGVEFMRRLRPDQEMYFHSDFPEIDKLDPNDPALKSPDDFVLFNSTVNFNDFEGGELDFPEFDLIYKPERGDLVMLPGTRRYKHRVLPVTGTVTRYTATFWTADSFGMELKVSGSSLNLGLSDRYQ